MIRKAQKAVHAFHSRFGQTIGDRPGLRDGALRARLIAEESDEVLDAIEQGDLVEAIDGLCDLIYVCLGAAVAWGVELEPAFHAVHDSNMAKVGGTIDERGKLIKPAGWTPPDIAGLLAMQERIADLRAESRERVADLMRQDVHEDGGAK